ncbi:MAG TPA: biopolymer transporter ExbD [Candidatus Gallibacteroides avistercoris]|uniref:Biopolymer transporter ExbD n=1 Tax=Candidatus Gallibacteroides avistercoris TaxID=2840833 RepID=A0A9D1M7Q8_9BACT|nr:biopolymer transporter ExbD [Candidatus Gallibacteroides avistercoris]
MAEIQQNDKGGKQKGKQKKMTVRVDFTPMVDMNMLLITFFMLCTSLSKPNTMEIAMPSNDKVKEEEQTKVKESRFITIWFDKDNKVYYCEGIPDYKNWESIKESSYDADGIRALILNRNKDVIAKIKELKERKANGEITDEEYEEQAKEIRKDKNAPVVTVKGADDAIYKNMIDVLDELTIGNVATYALVPMEEGDSLLIENYKTKGETMKNYNL